MKKHIKIYMNHFGYGQDDYIPCEICGAKDGEVHHIDPRGMGGSKKKDQIENLIKLCRKHHDMAEAELFDAYGLKKFHEGFIDYFQRVGRTWFEEPLDPPGFKVYPLLPSDCFIKLRKDEKPTYPGMNATPFTIKFDKKWLPGGET